MELTLVLCDGLRTLGTEDALVTLLIHAKCVWFQMERSGDQLDHLREAVRRKILVYNFRYWIYEIGFKLGHAFKLPYFVWLAPCWSFSHYHKYLSWALFCWSILVLIGSSAAFNEYRNQQCGCHTATSYITTGCLPPWMVHFYCTLSCLGSYICSLRYLAGSPSVPELWLIYVLCWLLRFGHLGVQPTDVCCQQQFHNLSPQNVAWHDACLFVWWLTAVIGGFVAGECN